MKDRQRAGKEVPAEQDEMNWREALFTEGTADYVDQAYFRRKNEIGSIIGSQSLPSIFVGQLNKVKECYALDLFEATIVFCRAVIEAGCFEALRRKGEIDQGVGDIREYKLGALINGIKRFVSRPKYNQADKVIDLASNILHSKCDEIVVSEKEAYGSIKYTFAIIEDLFR